MTKAIIPAALVALILTPPVLADDFKDAPCFSDNPPATCPPPEEALKMLDDLDAAMTEYLAAVEEWGRKYEEQYYQCTDQRGEMTLEIFQSFNAGARTPGTKIKAVGYKEVGPMRLYPYLDDEYEPTGPFLWMRPNGGTTLHMGVDEKGSEVWMCTAAPWPEAQ